MEIVVGVVVSFLGGIGLGYIFFWGLWKTVSRLSDVNNPYLWMFASFIIRTAVVVLGFYLILQVHWQLAAVGLIGFVVSRIILVRQFGKLDTIKGE